jgi:hypothetical protein
VSEAFLFPNNQGKRQGKMTLYTQFGKILHVLDRLPTSEKELEYIKKLFPQAIVHRKTNNWAKFLEGIKFKNLHWYK